MALSRLLQVLRELLKYAQLLLEKRRRVELCHANLSNSAVTNKVAEAKNVSNYGLIVRLSEHESDKFTDCSEEHQYVIRSLCLIPQTQLFIFCEGLCDPLRNFVLVDESRLIILLR